MIVSIVMNYHYYYHYYCYYPYHPHCSAIRTAPSDLSASAPNCFVRLLQLADRSLAPSSADPYYYYHYYHYCFHYDYYEYDYYDHYHYYS